MKEARRGQLLIHTTRKLARQGARAIELPASEIALVAPAFTHAERGALR